MAKRKSRENSDRQTDYGNRRACNTGSWLMAGLVAPAAAIVAEVVYAAIRGRHGVAAAIAITVIDAVVVVEIVGAVLPIAWTVLPVL